ncbi:hypothetical protein K1719_037621 [Acacia pycnantha]|nr:hypothetical protein K1719_037621 [Acacia pycnantha]
MEAHQTQRITNKEQRNKSAPIAGLLVFGGALAVTGLIAIASFVTKRSKAKAPPHEPQQSESDHPSLQLSSTNHDNACYETSYTTKDQVLSCESLPSQTSILEDKPDLKVETYVEEESTTSLHQEIVLSDDSPPESTVSLNDNETGLEGQESSADSPCLEEVDQSVPQEPLKSVEINEGQHDDDSATTETEDDIVEEHDGVGFERSENSSGATGRTSLNSSEAAIWPAELIEEEGQMANEQSEAEGAAELNIPRTDDKSHSGANVSEFSGYAGNDKVMASAKASSSEKPNLYAALNNHLTISEFKTWTILLLLFAILLLVLLTHHNGMSGSLTVAIL